MLYSSNKKNDILFAFVYPIEQRQCLYISIRRTDIQLNHDSEEKKTGDCHNKEVCY